MFRGAASSAPTRLTALLLTALLLGALPSHLSAQAQSEGERLAAGGLGRMEVAELHLRLAVLAAEADASLDFDRHARAALALDPELASPVLEASYASRFAEWVASARRLRIELSRQSEALRVVVHAPEGLVQTVTLTAGDWSRTLPWRGEPRVVRPPLEAGPVAVEALDEYGNRLARAGASSRAASTEVSDGAVSELSVSELSVSDVAVSPPAVSEPSLVESPWLWVGVGLVAIGIGVVVGLTAFGERYLLDAPVVR